MSLQCRDDVDEICSFPCVHLALSHPSVRFRLGDNPLGLVQFGTVHFEERGIRPEVRTVEASVRVGTRTSHDRDRAIAFRQSLSEDAASEPLQVGRVVDPIHDATMKDKLSEYLKGTLIDVSGNVVTEDGVNDTADLQWFTRSVLAQALTNGYCAIPIVAGPCPHPNACLNCAHFRTDATFLEVHRAELRETERVIAKADANGWVRQSEMNARKRTSLINIVTTLEASHG